MYLLSQVIQDHTYKHTVKGHGAQSVDCLFSMKAIDYIPSTKWAWCMPVIWSGGRKIKNSRSGLERWPRRKEHWLQFQRIQYPYPFLASMGTVHMCCTDIHAGKNTQTYKKKNLKKKRVQGYPLFQLVWCKPVLHETILKREKKKTSKILNIIKALYRKLWQNVSSW